MFDEIKYSIKMQSKIAAHTRSTKQASVCVVCANRPHVHRQTMPARAHRQIMLTLVFGSFIFRNFPILEYRQNFVQNFSPSFEVPRSFIIWRECANILVGMRQCFGGNLGIFRRECTHIFWGDTNKFQLNSISFWSSGKFYPELPPLCQTRNFQSLPWETKDGASEAGTKESLLPIPTKTQWIVGFLEFNAFLK